MGVLDPKALENLREMVGGDVEFMIDLMNTFLEDAPRMLTDMRQSLESGDVALLHRAAHSLKSNSAEFGAQALSKLCQEIEALSKENLTEGMDRLVTSAETEFDKVKAELQAMQQEL